MKLKLGSAQPSLYLLSLVEILSVSMFFLQKVTSLEKDFDFKRIHIYFVTFIFISAKFEIKCPQSNYK